MTDKEFDRLQDELKALEIETGFILSESSTQNVGYEVISKLQKVTHSIPLKSLDKTKSVNDLHRFTGGEKCVLMLKGDGLTCELIYNNGELIQGSTRGNSTIGEDITHNVRTFKNIPLKINYEGYLKLAGEAVIYNKDFKFINYKENGKYKNSRNLVAGSVRQLDSKICSERFVNFLAFNILTCEKDLETVEDQFEFLNSQGFETIPYKIVEDIDEEIIGDMKDIAAIEGIPIDGEVLKYNDIAYGKSLGETSHHPLNAIAFKFYDEVSETEYITTEWRTSRTGQLNPIGIFQPCDVSGSEIERATLHNVDYFEELQLGQGDTVTLIKANDVIPKITGNLTRSNTEKIPEVCPVCGDKTEVRLLKTARVLFCTNADCPSKKIAQFEHFCSRDAMNILGVSEAILETFIDMGFIKTIPDLYDLEYYKDRIIMLEGFGEKSYNKIIEAIDNSRTCKLENFLYGLGIPNVGKGTAKDISNHFKGSVDDLFDAIGNWFDFSTIKDIGEITNDSIYKWLTEENIEMYSELLRCLEFETKETKVIAENPIKDKKIYCTGTFASYKKDQLKSIIANLGGEFAVGYSKSLSILVVGSLKGSSKEDKAKKDGVKIMYEDEFLKIIKDMI